MLSDFSFPDIYVDRKHRFPPVSDRMSSSMLQLSKLFVARYWSIESIWLEDSASPTPIATLSRVWPGGHRQRNGAAEAEMSLELSALLP